MAKKSLTTEWKEVYGAVDNPRKVLFSGGVADTGQRAIYLSIGRNKDIDILLSLNANSMITLDIAPLTSVYAKMSGGTAELGVYRID